MRRTTVALRIFLRRHSKNLVPVIVGALLGAVPALAAVWIQNSYADRAALQARRLQALTDWVRTCNGATELTHITAATLVNVGRVTQSDSVTTIKATLDLYPDPGALMAEYRKVALEFKTATDLVNLLFPVSLPPMVLSSVLPYHISPSTPSASPLGREQLETVMVTQAKVFEQYCAETQKTLKDLVNR